MWRHKLPLLREVTPDSHWAQVDARLWDERDTLLPKRKPSFFHGTPLHSLLTFAGCDTVIVTGATRLRPPPPRAEVTSSTHVLAYLVELNPNRDRVEAATA